MASNIVNENEIHAITPHILQLQMSFIAKCTIIKMKRTSTDFNDFNFHDFIIILHIYYLLSVESNFTSARYQHMTHRVNDMCMRVCVCVREEIYIHTSSATCYQ